jgi:hypothetical protein
VAPGSGRPATELLRRIRGVTWRWRLDAPARAKERATMGVIAQEVEEVFPDLVVTGKDGHKRVDYIGLIGPLIEAVKELDDRVRALEEQADRGDGPPDA